ncbi:unnamed protein product [Rhodiola kirilowii]
MAYQIVCCFGACSYGIDEETAAILQDDLLWHKNYGRCVCGNYSMAVLQGNQVLEDQCQFESSQQFGTFVGIYDGHRGPDAARFVCDRIFLRFQRIILATGYNTRVTAEPIERAFLRMEEEFFDHVRELWNVQPSIATVGTCCLVGVVYHQTLFIANCGDSRAILGRKDGGFTQLNTEHNARITEIQNQLQLLHPGDPNIVIINRGSWRVKGISQVTKSIGDAFLKRPEYNTEAIDYRLRLHPPHDHMPYLTAQPDIYTHQLQQDDSFIIFASHGLWKFLNNADAVKIVHKHPHSGSANKIIKAALKGAARFHNMSYKRLCQTGKNARHIFHDDITVVVLFLNHDLIARGSTQRNPVSVRSALDH